MRMGEGERGGERDGSQGGQVPGKACTCRFILRAVQGMCVCRWRRTGGERAAEVGMCRRSSGDGGLGVWPWKG